jgi:putative endonuclease
MRTKGFEIETYVSEYLAKQGINIIERNFSCKMGEIDIIATHKNSEQENILIFIEVRYRANTFFGSASESVSYAKQKKLIRTAQYYLMRNPWGQKLNCRFDIIGVSLKNNQPVIEWIEHAFQC